MHVPLGRAVQEISLHLYPMAKRIFSPGPEMIMWSPGTSYRVPPDFSIGTYRDLGLSAFLNCLWGLSLVFNSTISRLCLGPTSCQMSAFQLCTGQPLTSSLWSEQPASRSASLCPKLQRTSGAIISGMCPGDWQQRGACSLRLSPLRVERRSHTLPAPLEIYMLKHQYDTSVPLTF